jgi:hypothetical protein
MLPINTITVSQSGPSAESCLCDGGVIFEMKGEDQKPRRQCIICQAFKRSAHALGDEFREVAKISNQVEGFEHWDLTIRGNITMVLRQKELKRSSDTSEEDPIIEYSTSTEELEEDNTKGDQAYVDISDEDKGISTPPHSAQQTCPDAPTKPRRGYSPARRRLNFVPVTLAPEVPAKSLRTTKKRLRKRSDKGKQESHKKSK